MPLSCTGKSRDHGEAKTVGLSIYDRGCRGEMNTLLGGDDRQSIAMDIHTTMRIPIKLKEKSVELTKRTWNLIGPSEVRRKDENLRIMAILVFLNRHSNITIANLGKPLHSTKV
jgi:hypothetical protein